MRLICGYCNECTKSTTIMDLYMGIAYLKMALWN